MFKKNEVILEIYIKKNSMRWNTHRDFCSHSDYKWTIVGMQKAHSYTHSERKMKKKNILNFFKTGQECLGMNCVRELVYCSLFNVPMRVLVIYFITAICIGSYFPFFVESFVCFCTMKITDADDSKSLPKQCIFY